MLWMRRQGNKALIQTRVAVEIGDRLPKSCTRNGMKQTKGEDTVKRLERDVAQGGDSPREAVVQQILILHEAANVGIEPETTIRISNV